MSEGRITVIEPTYEYKIETYTDRTSQIVSEFIAREVKQGWEPVSHTYTDRPATAPLCANRWTVLYRRPKQEKEGSAK